MPKDTKRYMVITTVVIVLVTGLFLLVPQFRETYSLEQSTLAGNEKVNKGNSQDSENVSKVETIEELREKAKKVKANELGSIPILVYHKIGEKEGRWTRTPENFRGDLQELYDRGYVLVSLNDYLTGNMNIPAGKSPAIITFDDSTEGHFRLLEKDGELEVDPKSAVGILRDFGEEHPGFGHIATFFINANPFGQDQYWQKKLEMLDEWGFEIGNHTYGHQYLKELSAEQVSDQIVRLQQQVQQVLPDYKIKSFAIVQDGVPESYETLLSGEKNGIKYNHDGILLWAWRDAYSPFHKDYDRKKIQRIQVFQGNGKSSLVNWLERLSAKRYISDGKKETLAIPDGWQEAVKKDHGKKLVVYKLNSAEPQRTPVKDKEALEARGIHVTFSYASSKGRRDKILELIEREKFNTIQLDVKDESGRIGYLSEVKLAQEIGAGRKMVPIKEFLHELRERNVYSIARIVIFRDPFLAKKKPYLQVRHQDGLPVLKGVWVSPYSKEVWDYNIELAKEAYELGFDEVQFDYIRFPENARTAIYDGKDERHRVEVISDLLQYARKTLGWERIISATVFGFTGFAVDDMGIGQRPERFAPYIDYISPMVYPSHYGRGNYGFDNPNAYPYEVVDKSMNDFQRLIESTGCQLRPWLQSFSLGRPAYGRDEVVAQIRATEDNGINTWLLWSPSVRYPDGLSLKENKESI